MPSDQLGCEGRNSSMASHPREIVGLVIVVAGGGAILGSTFQVWLLNKGFRISPAFKAVTREERAAAEDRGEVAQRRFVRVGLTLGLLLIVIGIVLLAI